MNCKPGDLAYVVPFGVETPGLVGRFVIVEERAVGDVWVEGCLYGECTASWVCRSADGSPLPVAHPLVGHAGWVRKRVIDDVILRPIRDPGDDAQDETLQWLPVPSTEKEAA